MGSRLWASRLVVAAVLVMAAVGSVALLNGGGQQPAASATVHGDGLSDSHDGFRLVPVTLPRERGDAAPVAFRIVDTQDRPLTAYHVHRSKRLHLYVARDDLHAYQHLYPTLDGDTWRTSIEVPDGGQYRLFVEFMPRVESGAPHPVMLGVPFVVPGDTEFVPLPAPAASVTVDGVTVTRPEGVTQPRVGRDTTLRFRVSGGSGTPEPHLGGYGHVAAFHATTLAAVPVRPVEAGDNPPKRAELTFRTRFRERGEHRLFVEFRIGGAHHTAGFTVFVT